MLLSSKNNFHFRDYHILHLSLNCLIKIQRWTLVWFGRVVASESNPPAWMTLTSNSVALSLQPWFGSSSHVKAFQLLVQQAKLITLTLVDGILRVSLVVGLHICISRALRFSWLLRLETCSKVQHCSFGLELPVSPTYFPFIPLCLLNFHLACINVPDLF